MALRMAEHVATSFDALRVEPTPVHLRATLDGTPALDTREALLVWEPGRVSVSWSTCHCSGVSAGGHHTVHCTRCRFYVWHLR